MRLLLVSPYFPPEIGSASHLFFELGREFVRRGHVVSVATLFPRYNVLEQPAAYRRRLTMREVVHGMTVSRVRVPSYQRRSRVVRGLDQFLVTAALGIAGMATGPTDLVLQYSPPLPVGLASFGLARLRRAPWVLNIQDLFPQSAMDLGLLRNKAIIRAYEALESFLYRSTTHVTVHSAGNAAHVHRRGIPAAKVSILHNWVDVNQLGRGTRMNAFRAAHQLGDNFVVTFAGVLGYSQDLDVVLEAAARLADVPALMFLVVGDGVEKARLVEKAHGLRLANVRFLPMVPRDVYADLLAASDVGLATLRAEVRTPVVPSKIPSVMGAGRPIVAALDLNGDAPKLIADAQGGYSVAAGNVDDLVRVIRALHADRELCARLGANGRRFAEQQLSLDAAVSRYEDLFASVSRKQSGGS